MTYVKRVLIAVDQLLAVVIFGTMPDETISAMAHRREWQRFERFINWLFDNPKHCEEAYQAEERGAQNAPVYSEEK